MDVIERVKQMILEGKVALSLNLENRILNDQCTLDDINFLKRNFNMLDYIESKK